MKHILILLALVFSMATVNAQPNSSENDYEKGNKYYETGKYKLAFDEFQKAADQGDAIAQHNIGMMYYYGQGVKKNYPQAFTWLQKAALQGDPEAQYNLGLLYYYGEGVEKNNTQAFIWTQKAAEQGHVGAQQGLQVMQYRGEGLLKS